ncbi:MAG: hypothetical protein ABFS46_22475 [Myxococcota bacterium]
MPGNPSQPRIPLALCTLLLIASCASPTQRAIKDMRSQIAFGTQRLVDPRDEGGVEGERDAVAANRRAIVERSLVLTQAEQERFWPLYEDYHDERRMLSDRRVKLVESFALERDDPEGTRAMDMIEEALAIREDQQTLRRRFIELFEAVLPPPKLLRYVQIESKLDAIIDYELARNIPLAP